MTLSGRHALVTGASRGIGAAIVEALVEQGARVTALGRDTGRLHALWSDCAQVRCATCDVTEADAVEVATAAAARAFGIVEILVNNAGQAISAPFSRSSADDFRQLFEVNVLGAVHSAQAVLPGLRGRDYGRIINVASLAGLQGMAYTTAYAASKHALVGLTRALAHELATTAITVNAICPGFVATEMADRAVANVVGKTGRAPDAALAEIVRGNPQQRLVQPGEVAAAAAWLCSPASASVNGQCIAIDGGQSA